MMFIINVFFRNIFNLIKYSHKNFEFEQMTMKIFDIFKTSIIRTKIVIMTILLFNPIIILYNSLINTFQMIFLYLIELQ